MTAAAKADLIAEAVKDSINAGPLEDYDPAERKHALEIALEDVQRIQEAGGEFPIVTVFPRAERKARGSRTTWTREYDIAICVQSRCVFGDKERQDELTYLVEQITDHLGTAGTMASCPLVRSEIVLFDLKQLHELQHFFAVPVFTYRIER